MLPVCQKYGMGVIPWSPLAGGFLSGAYRRDQASEPVSGASRMPDRYDLTLPVNQRKMVAVDALAKVAGEAGHQPHPPRPRLCLSHPAVTAAIIGPRTMEHLEKPDRRRRGACSTRPPWIASTRSCLPGTNLNPADAGWAPPEITDRRLRRR